MAIITALILFMCVTTASGMDDPFPSGYLMGNLGTIIWDDGMGGRSPWFPAAALHSGSGLVISAGAVSYYDRMDNLEDRLIYRAVSGAGYAGQIIKIKAAVSQFNAFGIFYSQTGFLSVGYRGFSLEATGQRFFVRGKKEMTRTLGELGAAVWVPFKYAAVMFQTEHIVLKESRSGSDTPFLLRGSIHTKRNLFGAQGVTIEVIPSQVQPVRFTLGEEYRLFGWLGIHAAVSTNPVMIGIGVVAEWSRAGAALSFVSHPELGWSKGFTAEYRPRLR